MNAIPVYRINEHNEAFYVWHQAIKDGILPKEDNYLLHIDHHDDMVGGGYRFDPNAVPEDLPKIERITYEDLGIANFIVPAIHEGIFSKVHIVQNLFPCPASRAEKITVCTDGKMILQQDYVPMLYGQYIREHDRRYRRFTYLENGLNEELLPVDEINGKLVLDVDLDYFCWDDSLSTRNPKRVEITAEEWERFHADPYHPFRILPVAVIRPVTENGRYYLEYKEEIRPQAVPSEERVEKRADRLMAWLKDRKIVPDVIDICSSCYSGYLPATAVTWVTDIFMKKLSEVYELRML